MPDFIFDFVFKYAWFIFGIFSILQLISLPLRANAIAGQLRENSESVRAFLLGFAIYITVPYFVLGGIQLLGSFENAFYIFFAPLNNPFVLIALGFTVLWWLLGAYFIYFREGAKALMRYGLIRGIGAGNETRVKLLLALGMVGGLFGLIVARFIFPPFAF
jgi:hypothetical protein